MTDLVPGRVAPPPGPLLRGALGRRHPRRTDPAHHAAASPSPEMPLEAHVDRRATALSAFSPRLDWTVIRRLDGLLQGDYRTLFRGHRDRPRRPARVPARRRRPRHIDWNVTARMQTSLRPRVQRGPRADGLVPARPEPVGGFRHRDAESKRSCPLEFVTILARLLTRHGNPVGALLYGDRMERTIPPGPRAAARAAPAASHADPPRVTRPRACTDLAAFLRAALPVLKRRALVFVVSDFISSPGLGRAARAARPAP